MERKPTTDFVKPSVGEGVDSLGSETKTTKKKNSLFVPPAVLRPELPVESPTDRPKREFFDFAKTDRTEISDDTAETQDDPSLEMLTSGEEQQVNRDIAEQHLQVLETTDPAAAAEYAPAQAMLQRIAEEQIPANEAFEMSAAEAGMSEQEIADVLEVSIEDDQAPDAEATDIEAIETSDEEDEPDQLQPVAAPTSAGAGSGSGGGVPGSGAPGVGGAAGGSGSGGGGQAGGPTMPTGPIGPVGPNTPPSPATRAPQPVNTPNTAPANNPNNYDRNRNRNRAGQLLVVGIVGYLIGRRRGRIRTEQKLLPVQRKLEKQVKTLEQTMYYREQQLIAAQRRKVEQAKRSTPERPIDQPKPIERPLQHEQRFQIGHQESRLHLEKPVRAERLGHMVVAAEAPKPAGKSHAEQPKSIRQAFKPEAVKDMDRAELLELSEKIVVEGANLRRIYESRLIGERQLRHLVSEYLRGKDIRPLLRREMVEHEIDFERDPILRDRVRTHLASGAGSGGLGDLLASVGIVEKESNPELEHRIRKEVERREAAEQKHSKTRVVTDVGMVAAITVLAIVVAVLALRG